jgi:hypothetical protein
VSGSAGNTTLSTPQIPSHNHQGYGQGCTPNITGIRGTINVQSALPQNNSGSVSTGGGGSHNHPLTISSSTFSGNAINLAVKYVDVIRATKN